MLNINNQSAEFSRKSKRFIRIRERTIIAGHEIQAIGEFVLCQFTMLAPKWCWWARRALRAELRYSRHSILSRCALIPLASSAVEFLC